MFLLLVLLCPLILILRVDLFEGTVQGILLLFESPELARKINRRKAIAGTTEDQYHSQNTEQQNRCQMHNEFRDTPKTGDDFNLGLWVSLAVLSVVCLLYTSRCV